jgi:hypothetical protein
VSASLCPCDSVSSDNLSCRPPSALINSHSSPQPTLIPGTPPVGSPSDGMNAMQFREFMLYNLKLQQATRYSTILEGPILLFTLAVDGLASRGNQNLPPLSTNREVYFSEATK